MEGVPVYSRSPFFINLKINFMSKQYYISTVDIFQKKTRELLLKAFSHIADVVGSTMGPGGRTVSINEPAQAVATKDGANILRVMSYRDHFLHFASTILRDVTGRTVDRVGDGTTLTTLLTYKLLKAALTGSNKDNVYEKLENMRLQVDDIKRLINKIKYKLDLASEKDIRILRNVATISANNNVEYGMLVSEVVSEIGKDGYVSVKESMTGHNYSEKKRGYVLGAGAVHRAFLRNQKKVLVRDPYTLIIDSELDDYDKDVQMVIKGWLQRNKLDGHESPKPLVLFVRSLKGPAIQFLISNAQKLPIYCVQIPTFLYKRSDRYDIIKDLQEVCGISRLYSPVEGYDIKQWDNDEDSIDSFGRVKQIEIQETECGIEYEGVKDVEEKVNRRIADLESKIDDEPDNKLLKTRLGILRSGIGVIYVDIASETEKKYVLDLLDDSTKACFSALKNGVVPGGGQTLLRIAYHDIFKKSILHNVLTSPFRIIMDNSGYSGKYISEVSKKLRAENYMVVFNAKTRAYNLVRDTDVWDPAEVAIEALDNAMSAVNMATSRYMINIEMNEDENKSGENS